MSDKIVVKQLPFEKGNMVAETGLIDYNRRPIIVGDLLKVYHFTAARHRRQVFMYKLIMDVPSLGLRVVDVVDLAQKGGDLKTAHSASLSALRNEHVEIIDGPMQMVNGKEVYWWERATTARPAPAGEHEAGNEAR